MREYIVIILLFLVLNPVFSATASCRHKLYDETVVEFHGDISSVIELQNLTLEEAKESCREFGRCKAVSSSENGGFYSLVLDEIVGLLSKPNSTSVVWLKNCEEWTDFRVVKEPFCPIYYEPVLKGTNISVIKAFSESESVLLKKTQFMRTKFDINSNKYESFKVGSLLINSKLIRLPEKVFTEPPIKSWCQAGGCVISPRTYFHSVSKNFSILGITDKHGIGHVIFLNESDNVTAHIKPKNKDKHGAIAGIYGFHDGRFAVSLFMPENKSSTQTHFIIQLYRADLSLEWETNLNSAITIPDRKVGDFRLTYGHGYFAVYFSVYGIANFANGSNGEQLSFVDERGRIMPPSYSIADQKFVNTGDLWGCSHSLGQLVKFHQIDKQFITVCASDLYPKGISVGDFLDGTLLYKTYGNGRGISNAQLGQIAPKNSGWNLIISAKNSSCCVGKGIGLITIYNEIDETTGQQAFDGVTWLTQTNGDTESDPVIARIYLDELNDSIKELFVVGWFDKSKKSYIIGIINTFGKFIEQPSKVSNLAGKCNNKHCISWGNRDDSLHTVIDGSVAWISVQSTSNFITFYRGKN